MHTCVCMYAYVCHQHKQCKEVLRPKDLGTADLSYTNIIKSGILLLLQPALALYILFWVILTFFLVEVSVNKSLLVLTTQSILNDTPWYNWYN